MGKQVIIARDGPGFLANRCARPFGLEALRLCEGVAGHATIDRIVRMGGGFRMGPFELMDLVGVDVGFEVSKSFWEQSFHEPRWRPSLIQARMVQAGRFGRKAGRGYYDYAAGPHRHRPQDPEPPAAGGSGTCRVEGDGRLAEELRRARAARPVSTCGSPGVQQRRDSEPPGRRIRRALAGGLARGAGGRAAPAASSAWTASSPSSTWAADAVGFHALPPLDESQLVELTRSSRDADGVAGQVESFFNSLGKHVEWVGDAPGMVLGRIVCQLINEACFALAEGVGSASDIDTAMSWATTIRAGRSSGRDLIELDQVLATLDALYEELREERYRASPLLRRMVAEGLLGQSTGEGFFRYD